MRQILQLLSLSTSIAASLPALSSQLLLSVASKPLSVAETLIHGLWSTASSVDFFTSVEHESSDRTFDTKAEQVLFFTDRPIVSDGNGQVLKFLSGSSEAQRSDVTMGQISVNNAQVLPSGIAPPEELHERNLSTAITSIQVNDTYQDLERFLNEIEKTCKESAPRKVCIFIPGFCMSFGQSIASAAALQKYSNIPVILYSWPSQDLPFIWNYFNDSKLNERSMSLHGSKMIDAITKRIGAEKIILVGFSQGAKLAVQYALKRQHSAQGEIPTPFFAQVLSRADQSCGDFQDNLPTILNNSTATALFVSKQDRLLLVSGHLLHGRLLVASKRTGSISPDEFEVPDHLEETLHLIDDSGSDNKITNHTFNARGIANWLTTLRVSSQN